MNRVITEDIRYLITYGSHLPFFSKWFEPYNHFIKDGKMIVYDLQELKYILDGELWMDIDIDHL